MDEHDILDLRGLKCPLPALMTRRHLTKAASGSRVTVLTTDPLAVVDIPHMCNQDGHDVIDARKAGGHHIFVIGKS